jgi:hypothetical protein
VGTILLDISKAKRKEMHLDREQGIKGKDGFSIDNEDEGLMDWRNNVRYLRIN